MHPDWQKCKVCVREQRKIRVERKTRAFYESFTSQAKFDYITDDSRF